MQPATPTPSTYKELCNDPSQNPLGAGERYTDKLLGMYTSWSAQGLNPTPEDELRAEFLVNNTHGLVGGVGFFVLDDAHTVRASTTSTIFAPTQVTDARPIVEKYLPTWEMPKVRTSSL